MIFFFYFAFYLIENKIAKSGPLYLVLSCDLFPTVEINKKVEITALFVTTLKHSFVCHPKYFKLPGY